MAGENSKKYGIFSSLRNSKSVNPDEPEKPYTWESFFKYMSNEIDKRIISHTAEKQLAYIGGKCRFTPTIEQDDFTKTTTLNVDAELYFQLPNDDEKNIERYPLHTERNFSDFNLKDESTLTTLKALLIQPLEVKIAKPE
ncbi:hypothetical protein [Ruminococcus sp.]|uniref:hypothetical protein n=1 Tax=Ruminococcus sp. TaxID=41978 RepID=UPI0025FA1431|nr:hypothetical protein [Ruminococcus sp.]